MDNKTCYCLPFYSGEFCETYIGCPTGVSDAICEEILKANQISQETFENVRGDLLSYYGDDYYYTDEFHTEFIQCKDQCFVKDCDANADDMAKYMCKYLCLRQCKQKLAPTLFDDHIKANSTI